MKLWLLPEPDSPTIARVSPGRRSRARPRTASTGPSGVAKRTAKSFTVRMGSLADASISAILGIERVAQAVA